MFFWINSATTFDLMWFSRIFCGQLFIFFLTNNGSSNRMSFNYSVICKWRKKQIKPTKFSCHLKRPCVSHLFSKSILKLSCVFRLCFIPWKKKFLFGWFCNCICCLFEWAWWISLCVSRVSVICSICLVFLTVFSVHIQIDRIIIHLIEMESCFYWAMAHVTMNALNCLDIEQKTIECCCQCYYCSKSAA